MTGNGRVRLTDAEGGRGASGERRQCEGRSESEREAAHEACAGASHAVLHIGGETIRADIWEAARRSNENEPPLPEEVVIEFVRLMDELAAKRR